MGDDKSEIPSFLKTHNSMERDACVERACDLDTQYFRAHEDLVDCRLSVENLLLEDKGEESREVLKATKLRNATYQEYPAASKKLLEACDAENGLIGRVRKQNKATKTCAGRLFQVVGESVGAITETKTLVVDTFSQNMTLGSQVISPKEKSCVWMSRRP